MTTHDQQRLEEIRKRVKAGTESLWDGGSGVTTSRSEVLYLLSLIDSQRAEIDSIEDEKLPHMCRDGHEEIRHRDSEHEQCIVCRQQAALRQAVEALETLPEELRAAMTGHKGEAYRIATQLTDDALQSLQPFLSPPNA